MLHSLLGLFKKAPPNAPTTWDVMVVPDSASAMPHSFRLDRWMLQVGVGTILLVVGGTIVLWTGSLSRAYQGKRTEVEALERLVSQDREAMQAELTQAQTSLQEVREAMVPLLETENKMRAIAGLEPRYRDPDLAVGGQGGRGEYHELDDTVALVDPVDLDLPEMPSWENASVSVMMAEFAQLRDSYDSIETSLTRQSDRLDNTPIINPVDHVDAWISSAYGYRHDPFKKNRRFHEGLDIVAPRGSAIIAPANGDVTFAGWKSGLGKLVVIKHKFGFETEYAHCDKLAVSKGAHVVRGEVIGYLGSTGRSTGPHLHYEVRKNGKLVNPYRYIIN